MTAIIFITSIFSIAFFLESIFGFGGMLISLAILSFFFDIKTLIPIALYIGSVASIAVLITDRKSINWNLFIKNILPLALCGTIVGVYLFNQLNSDLLLKIFSIFLIILSIKNIFIEKLPLMRYFKKPLLFSGGIIHGIYGTGGPFTLIAIKKDFKHKSELRSTMAVYFLLFNIIRIIQFEFSGIIRIGEIFANWWLILPIFVAVFLGYRIHNRLSESLFKKAINIFLLIAGIIYILR